MTRNVGPNERIVRLAIGAAAGAAAARAHGWQRAALCTASTSAFITGLTQYCPINAALGIEGRSQSLARESEHDAEVRDSEIRRETHTSAAMGRLPGTAISPEAGVR
jgi:hypothetical protein